MVSRSEGSGVQEAKRPGTGGHEVRGSGGEEDRRPGIYLSGSVPDLHGDEPVVDHHLGVKGER